MSVIQDDDFILMKHSTPLKIQNSGFCQHTNSRDASLVSQNILSRKPCLLKKQQTRYSAKTVLSAAFVSCSFQKIISAFKPN